MFQHISLRHDLDSVNLPFSHAVRAGDFLFVSGQVASDCLYPAEDISWSGNNRLSIAEQTKSVMENLKTILTEAGTGFDRVVMARIFLIDFRDYEAVNAVYTSYLTRDRLPCRTTVGVTGLADQCALEIDLIVYCGN
ncbi:MAG: RidA family protein [Oculatellaceae cyanobacterium bins.114]|nr:RidA family protein [Oculatellaceae cyanobacterium bins.114]